MTEETYQELLEIEYAKKKKVTLEALREMSVNELLEHLKLYKEYIMSLTEEHEQAIVDGKLSDYIEKQLNQVDNLECFLCKGINKALTNIMLDEDVLLHLITNVEKSK